MEEDKTQSKQAGEEGVFFRFEDDRAVDGDLHVVDRRKKVSRIIVGSRKEIDDGFIDQAGTRPSRRLIGGIGQTASRDTNPYVI